MGPEASRAWKYSRAGSCRLNRSSPETFSLYVHRSDDKEGCVASRCAIRIIGDTGHPKKAFAVARKIVFALNRGAATTKNFPRYIDSRKPGAEDLSMYREKASIVDCRGSIRKSNRGEFHGCAKIKEVDVVWILKSYVPGARKKDDGDNPKSMEGIAEKIGIKKATVSRIVNGKLWRHMWIQVVCSNT